jgi:glycosyltransferase involved in cell wall biosynthesis/GT2 family glycosyltransferase
MHLFWDAVIEPLMLIVRPRSIIEIGSDYGDNTANLLDYCQAVDAQLHVIDPQPKYDTEQWQQQHGQQLILHEDLSINVLGKMDFFDFVLIDGDHNWYTVIQELRLIESQCKQHELPFPVVLLHDIHWPYGRRDLYYDPQNIPVEYRKPFLPNGIYPGQADLAKTGGLNQNFNNAIYENDFQNGVLTAVEDFLAETKHELDFLQIPGLFGLGILVPKELKQRKPELKAFLSELTLPSGVEKHIRQIELDRLQAKIQSLENRLALTRLEKRYNKDIENLEGRLFTASQEIKAKQKVIQELSQAGDELRQKNKEILSLEDKLQELSKSVADKSIEAVRLTKELDKTSQALARQKLENSSLAIKLEDTNKRIELQQDEAALLATKIDRGRELINDEKEKSARLQASNRTKAEAIARRDRSIQDLSSGLNSLHDELGARKGEVKALSNLLDSLTRQVSSLIQSRSWQIGNGLGDIKRFLTGEPSRDPASPIRDTLKKYDQLKQGRVEVVETVRKPIKPPVVSVDFNALGAYREKRNLLIVAHSASQNIYGGERSFIDIVQSIDRDRFNIFCLFPAESEIIFDQIKNFADEILVMKYGWWNGGSFENEAIEQFVNLMCDKQIDLLHVNTIMLIEPLLAARSLGIPSILHSREIISKDQTLATRIGLDTQTIVTVVKGVADYIIVNSKATGELYDKGEDTFLLYNGVDTERQQLASPKTGEILRVGLVSSNLPKKGIEDFAQLARLAQQNLPNIRFTLIGELNEHVREMEQRKQAGDLPSNLHFMEYQEEIADCYRDIDIILNFSHFAESFGRTVAEAMAFRRPVICYEWGALPELVVHGQTGFLVPYRQYDKALEHLRFFADNPDQITHFGEAGRKRVVQNFSLSHLATNLNRIYDTVLTREMQNTAYRLVSRQLLKPEPGGKRKYRTVKSLPDSSAAPQSITAQKEYQGQQELEHLAHNLADRRACLKIAYFLWHFPVPSETFVLNELRFLVNNGYDVKVFCKGSPHRDFQPDFDIEYFPATSPKHLAQLLREHERNIVHSHFVYPTVTDFVWPACEQAKIPFTFIGHAQDIFRYENMQKNRISEVSASPWCLRVFVPGHFHRKFLIDQGVAENKIVINSQTIEFDFYKSSDKPDDRPYSKKNSICTIQRFVEKKGIETLIRAGKQLEDQGISVDIWGYGPLEEEYRKLIQQEQATNVRLCGQLKGREALRDALYDYDLFVSPSVRASDGDMDGIPTILMEAMAAGLPVLSSDVSSIPDLVKDGINGFLCKPNDMSGLVQAVNEFYALDPERVQTITENARQFINRTYSVDKSVNTLIRVWRRNTIDVVIVSHQNLPELKEVIRRLYKYTNTYFNLIVVDNNSDEEVVSYLSSLETQVGNMTLIQSDKNLMVGPGTNLAASQGSSEYIIYLCGKEGFIMNHGWDQLMINYMDEHPDVGLAGHLGYSPSYFDGRGYQIGQPQFSDYRNQHFAAENPERPFTHVQGGLFILRRKTFEEIGGFSEKIPHNATDVEYSYYVESCGWKLGDIPGIVSLYHKTLPNLHSKFDEHTLAAHPLTLETKQHFERITTGKVKKCNVCGWLGSEFEGRGSNEQTCPACRSSQRDRSLYRYLAGSSLTYRRLTCLDLNPSKSLSSHFAKMFDYRPTDNDQLSQIIESGKMPDSDKSVDLVIACGVLHKVRADKILMGEIFRVLKPGGLALIQVPYSGTETSPDNRSQTSFTRSYGRVDLMNQLEILQFEIDPVSFCSKTIEFDWRSLFVCTKPHKANIGHLSLAWSR